MLRDQAELRELLASLAPDSAEAAELRQKISRLEVEISLRIERLAKAGPKLWEPEVHFSSRNWPGPVE